MHDSPDIGHRLNELLVSAGEAELRPDLALRFGLYLSLLVRWNARLNLTAIRDEEGILGRHFVESIACARAIPPGVTTLLDFGSGAGFPGIPIALCRQEISVTLAESQAKKAAFLREAVRTLGLNATVYGYRAETLQAGFGGVAMRAVDRMEDAVVTAAGLLGPRGWLILMTTVKELAGLQAATGKDFEWSRTIQLPMSREGLIAIGARIG
jgi:16S rRNA (guanine527-N7)-methyltransferase